MLPQVTQFRFERVQSIHLHIFFVYSPIDKHINCFLLLTIVNNAKMMMDAQMSLQHTNLSVLNTYPEVGLVGHMII
jgi:hypothetical protein